MGEPSLYKTITETVPEFFFLFDLEQRKITFVSPQFYHLSGRDQESSQQDGFRSYIHPEDQPAFDQFFSNLSVENNFSNRIELRTRQELGNIRWVELNTFPVENEQEEKPKLVVGHILDITDKKERISILEEEQEKLDSVLKILAHDLRGPFSQVYMIADILKGMMNKGEQKKFGLYLEMLRGVGGRSMVLLDNLLRLVSLQEGTLSLDLKKYDLRHVLQNVADSFKVNIEEKQLKCTIEAPDYALVALVDALVLEQALGNILSNAIKFTPEGGSISLRIRKKGALAHIQIEDTGIGIPEKHIPDLFKEFSKIRREGLKGEKSTGLGLAISKQILKLHKGSIRVSSRERQGTLFSLELPLI